MQNKLNKYYLKRKYHHLISVSKHNSQIFENMVEWCFHHQWMKTPFNLVTSVTITFLIPSLLFAGDITEIHITERMSPGIILTIGKASSSHCCMELSWVHKYRVIRYKVANVLHSEMQKSRESCQPARIARRRSRKN